MRSISSPIVSLWRTILMTGGARIYGLLCNFAILILTARWLGPTGHGTVAAILGWVTLFATFSHLSLGQVAIHYAATQPNRNWLPNIFGSLVFSAAIATALGWLVALLLWFFPIVDGFHTLSAEMLSLGFLSLPFLIWEQYGSALLTALQRLDIYNRAQLWGRTLGLLVLIGLLMLGWGLAGILLALAAIQAIIALSGLRFLFKQVGTLTLPRLQPMRALIGDGLKLHLNAIGAVLITSTDVLIIYQFHGPTATGYYQLASQLLITMLIIPQSAALVLYGNLAKLGIDEAWGQQRGIVVGVLLLMALGGGIAALLAPWAIPLVAGAAFTPAIQIFRIMLLALFGATAAQVMAPQWIGRGMFWQVSALTLAVGILNVMLNLQLVPRYGIEGAAWATVISYTISILTNGLMAWHCERVFRRNNGPLALHMKKQA